MLTVRTDRYSDDFLVVMEIFLHNEQNNPIWFSKLVSIFEDRISKQDISKSLDKLTDRGMIEGHWCRIDTGWYYTFIVTDGFAGFVKGLINESINT